jgi:hypothetical protein
MGMKEDFISDLIDRAWVNPFSGHSLTKRNLFGDGQNLPEKFLWLI